MGKHEKVYFEEKRACINVKKIEKHAVRVRRREKKFEKHAVRVDKEKKRMEEENFVEKRLDAVEMKLAYLEDFTAKLQEVAVEQGKTIDILREENKLLSSRLRDLIDNLEEIPNRKPPHY